MRNLSEKFLGTQANDEAIKEDKKQRKEIELLLDRKLSDYEWFIVGCMKEKTKAAINDELKKYGPIKGNNPNYLIVEDCIKTEKSPTYWQDKLKAYYKNKIENHGLINVSFTIIPNKDGSLPLKEDLCEEIVRCLEAKDLEDPEVLGDNYKL